MKLVFSLLLAGLLAGVALAQDSQATVAAEKLADGISHASMRQIDDVVADDAAIYWIHAKFKSRRGFEEYMRGQFSSFDQHSLAFNEEGNAEDDTISTAWGEFMFDYGKTGTPVSSHFKGRYTAVAQKLNGGWQLVAIHISLPYPPDLPPAVGDNGGGGGQSDNGGGGQKAK